MARYQRRRAGLRAKPQEFNLWLAEGDARALGDLEVPNPTSSAFIRAGGLQSTSWYYRFDIAAALDPAEVLGLLQPGVPYPIMPHRFLSNPTIFRSKIPQYAG